MLAGFIDVIPAQIDAPTIKHGVHIIISYGAALFNCEAFLLYPEAVFWSHLQDKTIMNRFNTVYRRA
jgi:hypothetical protein